MPATILEGLFDGAPVGNDGSRSQRPYNPDSLADAYVYARNMDIDRPWHVTTVADSSHSMLGTGYNKKAIVVVKQPEYMVGDDITFPNPNSKTGSTIHRIKAVKPGYVYTQGINNAVGDGWTPVGEVYGKVILPKPKM